MYILSVDKYSLTEPAPLGNPLLRMQISPLSASKATVKIELALRARRYGTQTAIFTRLIPPLSDIAIRFRLGCLSGAGSFRFR